VTGSLTLSLVRDSSFDELRMTKSDELILRQAQDDRKSDKLRMTGRLLDIP